MTGIDGPFIGTNVGGDEGGLEALATWLGQMESVVEAAGSMLNDLVYDAAEAWVGGAGNYQFALQLETGRQAAFDLSDRLHKAVSHVEGCSAAIAASQRGLNAVAARAAEGGLLVTEGRVMSPRATRPLPAQNPGEQAHTYQEAPLNEEAIEASRLFNELIEEADQAMGPVADKLEEFAKGGRWFDGLVFSAGALVAEETTILARHESSRLAGRARYHGGLENYWRRSRGPGYIPGVDDNFDEFADRHGLLAELAERGSSRAGMVAKYLGGWWTSAVITGLELGVGLSGQERDGKVLVQVGTGAAAGTAAYAALIAGAFLAPALAVIVAAFVSVGVSNLVGIGYEEFVPESPHDKIERYG